MDKGNVYDLKIIYKQIVDVIFPTTKGELIGPKRFWWFFQDDMERRICSNRFFKNVSIGAICVLACLHNQRT